MTSNPNVTFELFKLPTLALICCIQHMDVFEIIDLSLLSKRAANIVRDVNWKDEKIEIILSLKKESKISLKFRSHPGLKWLIGFEDEKALENEEIPGPTTLRKIGDKTYVSFFDCVIKGPWAKLHMVFSSDCAYSNVTPLVEHLTHIFRTPVESVSLSELNDLTVQEILKWLINFQVSIDTVWMDCEEASRETIELLLNGLKVTKDLNVRSKLPKSFKYNKVINVLKLSVSHASWVSIDQVLKGNNSFLSLSDPRFTPEDLNFILKQWSISNVNPNLRYLELVQDVRKNFNAEQANKRSRIVLKGVNYAKHIPDIRKPTYIPLGKSSLFQPPIGPAYDISRSDGMVGTFSQHYCSGQTESANIFESYVFGFHVWNRGSTNTSEVSTAATVQEKKKKKKCAIM